MATHGRIGTDLERYHARKLRPHIVPGLYVSDGANSKPQRLTLDEYHTKLRMCGTSRSTAKGAVKAKTAGGVVHYRSVHCLGRPNDNKCARRRQRAANRTARAAP